MENETGLNEAEKLVFNMFVPFSIGFIFKSFHIKKNKLLIKRIKNMDLKRFGIENETKLAVSFST